jgi:hypothetical protein
MVAAVESFIKETLAAVMENVTWYLQMILDAR